MDLIFCQMVEHVRLSGLNFNKNRVFAISISRYSRLKIPEENVHKNDFLLSSVAQRYHARLTIERSRVRLPVGNFFKFFYHFQVCDSPRHAGHFAYDIVMVLACFTPSKIDRKM